MSYIDSPSKSPTIQAQARKSPRDEGLDDDPGTCSEDLSTIKKGWQTRIGESITKDIKGADQEVKSTDMKEKEKRNGDESLEETDGGDKDQEDGGGQVEHARGSSSNERNSTGHRGCGPPDETSPQIAKDLDKLLLDDNDPSDGSLKVFTGPTASMKKLHALLSKSKMASPKRNYFANADGKAQKARHSIVKAWEMVQAARLQQELAAKGDAFPLLALPTEIRLCIYQQLLVSDDRLILTWNGPRRAKEQQKPFHTAIMRTCKKCAEEGATVLYGDNVFDFAEIRRRPFFAKSFVNRVGAMNMSRVRVIIAEYHAAHEELSQLEEPDDMGKACHQLDVDFVRESLGPFNIQLDKLRFFAVSITPYGGDAGTKSLMKKQAPGMRGSKSLTKQWVDLKNDGIKEVAERICEKEPKFKMAEFSRDIGGRIAFDWATPLKERRWIAYNK